MRILTWNINGIRTLPQYHPWNGLKTGDAILDELGADIACFQEMKSTRPALARTFALPSTYHSFFSFPTSKSGYSGVAVYTKHPLTPLKAEEGLTSTVYPKLKQPWSEEERVSRSLDAYPLDLELEVPEDEEVDLTALDAEGRTLVVDFGLFVLINTYCPAETSPSPSRLAYKMNYHRMLEARVRRLVREGREVVLVGDLNACVGVGDHCDGGLESVREGFYGHPARAWARDMFGEAEPGEKLLVDVVRRLWPDRKAMYTCWNTKISARASNYGTRIDYILVTPALVPWIKGGDIQPDVKGSDHCPVWVDLWDEIEVEVGQDGERTKETIRLKDVMHVGEAREAPRLAAKYWEEYSGKQKLLSSFFGNGKAAAKEVVIPVTANSEEEALVDSSPKTIPLDLILDSGVDVPELPLSSQASSAYGPSSPSSSPPPATASTSNLSQSTQSTSSQPHSQPRSQSSKKRKKSSDPTPQSKSNEKKKQKVGQTKLSTFFAQPSTSSSARSGPTRQENIQAQDQMDADLLLALELSQQPPSLSPHVKPPCSPSSKSKSTAAWSHLLAPLQPPLCTVHREPAKEFTVNKAGPNKGKKFFVCARPVGPGYDRGKAERLREEVDWKWKCDYFKWASDVKKEAGRGDV